MNTYLLRDQLAARAATPADFDALKRLDTALAKHDALCVEQANLRLQTLQLRVENRRLRERLRQAHSDLDRFLVAHDRDNLS
jgi:hypothetical protein